MADSTGGALTILSAPGQPGVPEPAFQWTQGDAVAIARKNLHPTTSTFTIPYILSFILYEAPGDKSSVTYSHGTTLGSSTTVTFSSTEGVGLNFSGGSTGSFGGGSVSVSFTQSTQRTNGFSSTVTSGTTLPVSGGQDVPDHARDTFFILFDVPGTATEFNDGKPPAANVDLSQGQLWFLTAGQLNEIAQGQPSTIVNPDLLRIIAKDLPTPQDALNLLNADPFFTNEDITQNPSRYVPLVPDGGFTTNVVKFIGPPGGQPDGGVPVVPTNTYQNTYTDTTATGQGTGYSYSMGLTIPLATGINLTGTLQASYQSVTTNTMATVETDSITIGSDHVCEEGTVQLYRDQMFGGSILTVSNPGDIKNACQTMPMRLMSFEALSDWTVQGGGSASLSSNAASGAQSFSISAAPGGWTPIVSNPLSSALLRAAAKSSNLSQVSFALDIPATQPNPYWVGDAQMFISSPHANVFNAPLGEVNLTGLPEGQYNRIAFTVPSYALPAITADNPDVTFTIVLNVNAGTSGWLVDDLEIGE